MEHDLYSERVIRIKPPARKDIVVIRLLICCGILSMLLFCIWFFRAEHIGHGLIYTFLTFALLFKLFKMLHEWYHYWSISVPVMPESKREWKVDMLTTACPGEPRDLIVRTLKAMVAVKYPHTNYLCDEGDDPYLKEVCRELGVVHVTRKIKKDAKAGNINNALKQATGEICVVLDPDHVPVPEFLHRVLNYFEDEKIGYVQCIQAYGNQSESFVARGAAEQTYHFYGPMMMCMNTYNTVQAIGANCTFRRAALDSIGGHAAGLSEDMHTAMQLHAKGWKSVYVPEILTRGLVPSTLSAYYKQQLKWSRGTFDLLFHTLPGIFDRLSWRQKLHYLCIPMYFLHGLINFIDFLIPVLALFLAAVPWEVNLKFFASYFLPMATLSLVIRCFAQRWLAEPHERGFHLPGGILRTATWWIFLIGFIYTVFNIKVPYIPTPKEDEPENPWRLSLPNALACLVILLFIAYGLYIDWTPYSVAMAMFALTNAGMLGFVVLVSQQKLMGAIRQRLSAFSLYRVLADFCESSFNWFQNSMYFLLRNGTVAVTLVFSVIFMSYSSMEEEEEIRTGARQLQLGGFYTGMSVDRQNNLSFINTMESALGHRFSLLAVTQPWNSGEEIFPDRLQAQAKERNAMLLICWKGTSDRNFYRSICKGSHDEYLRKCAAWLRKHNEPFMISFDPGFEQRRESAAEYVSAWQHIVITLHQLGISNVTWLWAPSGPNSLHYYPGDNFVDWIGLTCVNEGRGPNDPAWRSFSELYLPCRRAYGKGDKPVLITGLGSCHSSMQDEWFKQAFQDIRYHYQEVRGFVFSEKASNAGCAAFTPMCLSLLANSLQHGSFSQRPLEGHALPAPEPRAQSRVNIAGRPGHFTLLHEGKPFYIRGIAYNTGHDWHDGNIPLTRRQLEKDFAKIKEMGANTIRRYGRGIYDRNVLNLAKEHDLKVLFGFWFDPKVDYFKDSARVAQYVKEVEETVIKYRDHPAVLAWSLGNESWGLLKHKFGKPYLVKVRQSYVRLIETLAQRIHELDSSRAVFSCMEHEEFQIPSELAALRDEAPSVDVVGVNSYYREQISRLQQITWRFDSLRPYVVTEFGPRGYWDPSHNLYSNGLLMEESDEQKASWYREQWKNFVEKHKGYNLGGFAYCWHDRAEGSWTWFGISDHQGRLKPAYYALKETWRGEYGGELPACAILSPREITPGAEYTFRAAELVDVNLEYEWVLMRENDFAEMWKIKGEGLTEVKLRIPDKSGGYRLYLYASDTRGNVSTSSLPIAVNLKTKR